MIQKLSGRGHFFLWSRSQVKVKVKVRDQIFFCMSGKPLSQGTYMPNIKALSKTIQKLWPMLIFSLK